MGNSRLDLLRRQNSGSVRRESLSRELRAIGVPDNLTVFLPLEESDLVRHQADESFVGRDTVQSGVVERQFSSADMDRLTDIVPPGSDDVFVIPSEAEVVGVLKWPTNVLNALWTRFVELKPDGFVVVDASFLSKVVVQVINDSGTGEDELDIAAWGERWCGHLSQLAR